MKILADENIPLVDEAFSHLGDVVRFKGRGLTREDLQEVEVLLVRSVTRVDAGLIEGSSLRFVGTATIGKDHIDEAALVERAIHFVSAPGSNSNSVGEYVVAALLALAADKGFELKGKTLGIVGVGNCGSRVAALAPALGVEILFCDPPLARQTGDQRYRPLKEVVDADILTFHVPLTREGVDATYHMINAELLERRPRESVLINASRGAIADTKAILGFVEKAREGNYTVLDVWENEPEISSDLLRRVALGTPHIAGYSYDGKVKGMRMLYSALCEFLGVAEEWSAAAHLKMNTPPIRVGGGKDSIAELDALVRQCYDIRQDDRDLRSLVGLEGLEKRNYFDSLRKGYRKRREFPAFGTSFVRSDPALRAQVRQLGFGVAADG